MLVGETDEESCTCRTHPTSTFFEVGTCEDPWLNFMWRQCCACKKFISIRGDEQWVIWVDLVGREDRAHEIISLEEGRVLRKKGKGGASEWGEVGVDLAVFARDI